MESTNTVVEAENYEKSQEINAEEVTKNHETEAKNKDDHIEQSKPNTVGIDDEDVELSEVEASKEFEGNIDEDELLKDTEENEETCNIVTESSKALNLGLQQTENSPKYNIDSTDNKSKPSAEDDVKEKDVSVQETSNNGEGLPDSSNENLKENEIHDSFSLSLSGGNEDNECTNEDADKFSEATSSFNFGSKEENLSEADTAVTSSNNEPIEKNSEISSGSFSNRLTTNESNANSEIEETGGESLNSESNVDTSKEETPIINESNEDNKLEETGGESLNIASNFDTSKAETPTINESNENSKLEETESLNTESNVDTSKADTDTLRSKIQDEPKEKTSHDCEDLNKSDGCDGTNFLRVDQENSRSEESFEPMETGGEDPFAQTSDVAMDTPASNEKEGDLNKPDNSMEISEANKSDNLGTPENNKKEGDLAKSDNPMESSEESQSAENEKDVLVDKEPKIVGLLVGRSNNVNMDVITVDSTDDVDTPNKKPANDAEVESKETMSASNRETETEAMDVEINYVDRISAEGIKSNKDVDTAKTQDDEVEEVMNENHGSTATATHKNKLGRPPLSKGKKKSSSEDSDSDIDIEELKAIDPVPKRTPKRNAAKRAECQIKVLSQLDKEMKERIDEEAAINVVNYKKAVEPLENNVEAASACFICKKVIGSHAYQVQVLGKCHYVCDNDCLNTFRDGPLNKSGDGGEIIPLSTVMSQLKTADIQPMDRAEFVRKCSQCSAIVDGNDERTLSWETMDFCSEECLGKYQQELGSHCANCKGNVQQASLGKYCVRFGYEVKQFCCSTCLEEFKKGLKVCSFCQKDISSGAEGFLAPVGDKGTFKDFCTPACMEKYEHMSSNQPIPPQINQCDVCTLLKPIEFEVLLDSKLNRLCSDICFSAYKFANKLSADRCDMCKKYFDKVAVGEKFNTFYEGVPHNFCSKTCMNVYILAKRKIVPCNWCKVKKYNFDMIKRVQNSGQVLMMCSLNCLTLYQVSVNAVSSKRIKCDMCASVAQAQYHLTMSDATIRNFCTYPCVMNFQQQYSKSPITLPGNGENPPIPTGAPKKVVPVKNDSGVSLPVISSVSSLTNGQPATTTTTTTSTHSAKPSGKLNLVARLCEPPVTRNKFTQTRPIMNTKSVSCRPHSNSVEVQTEEGFGKCVIPIPVPIFVPCPMAMYSMPYPVPVPFPLPIPVPVFLPTTRNSIKGIMKEIKRIREKVPEDPFEAELLMMAEMVAEDKPKDKDSSDSEAEADNDNSAAPSPPNSDVEGADDGAAADDGDNEEEEAEAETSNTFGEDIMQIALKMATELDTPASGEDLETQLPSSNIQQAGDSNDGSSTDTVKKETRGRKRAAPASKTPSKQTNSSEPKKRKSHHSSESSSQPLPAVDEPKPDANMKLKFTFGVNAWKSWVTQKNAEIEKLNASSGKKLKNLKTDMLQLTTDELNYSLCLFIQEVKKPNGTPYAPDTIYYLCLGIQQYLFENGRIDNIFTDPYFETFTDALDEVAKKFSELFNDHHYIVTRVEEEHLWESKQLGAHSPHVLLSTLMFFNTKHFNLTSVDEHLLLSFSHIMKHWKRNQNQSGSSSGRAPGSRNVLLRFYPPQSLVDDPTLKKKKVYEQQENEDNPLRCPVKLYEFYLSKCPDSVKNRNDVFYLQPERSCVPDSPVWYSTMALQREPLEKMLNRVKMVKEINIALLVP